MVKTGFIKTRVYYINAAEISSVEHWKGELLNAGKIGSRVTMKNRDTFIDARTPEQLLNDLYKLKNIDTRSRFGSGIAAERTTPTTTTNSTTEQLTNLTLTKR